MPVPTSAVLLQYCGEVVVVVVKLLVDTEQAKFSIILVRVTNVMSRSDTTIGPSAQFDFTCFKIMEYRLDPRFGFAIFLILISVGASGGRTEVRLG